MNNREGMELYFRAIKALPDAWISACTYVTTADIDHVVAANPQFAPMVFNRNGPNAGKWVEIVFRPFELK